VKVRKVGKTAGRMNGSLEDAIVLGEETIVSALAQCDKMSQASLLEEKLSSFGLLNSPLFAFLRQELGRPEVETLDEGMSFQEAANITGRVLIEIAGELIELHVDRIDLFDELLGNVLLSLLLLFSKCAKSQTGKSKGLGC